MTFVSETEQTFNDAEKLDNQQLNAKSYSYHDLKLWRQQWQDIASKMRQAKDLENLCQIATRELREKIDCDRALVFRLNSRDLGIVCAESKAPGWTPTLNESLPLLVFGLDIHQEYLEPVSMENVNTLETIPYQKQLLEKFQIQSSLALPIILEGEIWGVFALHQCHSPRQWQEKEISFILQVATEITYGLQRYEYQVEQQQQLQAKKSVGKVIEKILRISNVDKFFQTTTQEVRNLLRCDRVALYQFDSDWGGEFIAESVATGWVRLVGPDIKTVWADTYLQDTQGGRYAKGESWVVNDVYKAGLASCHVEILEQFDAKAYVISPVFFGDKLWGLVAAYQNSTSRKWQDWEVNFLNQIGMQFGVALVQTEYLEKLQEKSDQLSHIAEQEKAFSRITNRIRQATEINSVFKITTQELRQLLKCDRVTIYRFHPDWSGEFIAESLAHGWTSFVSGNDKTQWEDTHFQATQGGLPGKGQVVTVNDIHSQNLSACYVEMLEKLEIKAYIVAPIFFGNQLWGLLAAYQNANTRQWQEWETNIVSRMSDQLGLSLQQMEYLQQLQTKSQELADAAAREKAAKELLQLRSIQLLSAVRPALKGDLTVRAPITEDEMGTIADAYNNTLQALRQIVGQVQTAAQQVAQTSTSSDSYLLELTNLAQKQSEEITTALRQIEQMTDSTKAVATSADLVQVAVQQANQTITVGDGAMNRTVEAIQTIRETVSQTSRKIKRLSESSQNISKVVNLISNFATQTNVLALNAAIEATRAGEYGKGFAVVADEVRSLSRQSAAATSEIEKLVQEIKGETEDVSMAMETSMQQVLEGTNLVNETRQSLNAIVAATAQITQLIENITAATQTQIARSSSVTSSMKDVVEISQNTLNEAKELGIIFQQLSTMAQELLTTASKFKVS